MPVCCGCQKEWLTAGGLIKHLRAGCWHLRGVVDSRFKCGEEGCFREYFCANSFYKHLVREHKMDITRPSSDETLTSDTLIEQASSSESSVPVNESSQSNEYNNQDLSFDCLVQLISSLYANPLIPRNCIQLLITQFEGTFKKIGESISSKVIEGLSKKYAIDPNFLKTEFSRAFSSTLAPFADIKSEHKRLKFFEKLGSLISPIQVSVGTRTEFRKDQMCMVPSTIQVIPLGKVLVKLLSLDGLLENILTYTSKLKEFAEPIQNVMQGSVWKEIVEKKYSSSSVNDLHLPLMVYYDDFEVNNPLGSHASIHKLGATYVSLPFLPRKFFSLLNTILMLSVCHASDRVNMGNRMIFTSVIEMLNDLSLHGIDVSTRAFQGTIKFHVCCMTGDNLGLNGILGFVESFSANFCCRFCSASRLQMQNLFEEDTSLLRCLASYEQDLEMNNSSLTGVKEKSIFQIKPNFGLI